MLVILKNLIIFLAINLSSFANCDEERDLILSITDRKVPDEKLENFLFKNQDFSFDKIAFFDEDFQSCEQRQFCSMLFSEVLKQSVPFQVFSTDFSFALQETNSLNIISGNNRIQKKVLEQVPSPNTLAENVWIFPIWTKQALNENESMIAATEATSLIAEKMNINSQVYVMLLSKSEASNSFIIKMIEVYKINKYLPIQVNALQGTVYIWDRRKNLKGANMTIGVVNTLNGTNLGRHIYGLDWKWNLRYHCGPLQILQAGFFVQNSEKRNNILNSRINVKMIEQK